MININNNKNTEVREEMKINKQYKYFVVDTCDWLVVSGWEYKEDALDHLDELLEGTMTAVSGDYKVYTAKYLKTLNSDYNNGIDRNPFDPANWKGHSEDNSLDNSFKIDITPSWGYVAKSLLALIQINYKADINKADYKALKEQLTQMSQVADAHVKEQRQTMKGVK